MFFKLSYPNFDNEKLVFCYTLAKNGKKLTEKSSSPTISYNNLDYGDYTFTATVKSLSGEVLSDSIVYQFSYPAPILPFYLGMVWICLPALCLRIWLYSLAYKQDCTPQPKGGRSKTDGTEDEGSGTGTHYCRTTEDSSRKRIGNKRQRNSKHRIRYARVEKLYGRCKGATLKRNAPGNLKLTGCKQDSDADEESGYRFVLEYLSEQLRPHPQAFLQKSTREISELTANDMKICALLRLNLNTKDIANFTHLSIRGVESVRYRLRKKLGIPSEKSLTDFLIEFE